MSGPASTREASGAPSQMVFSSSCTVYGNPQYVPLDEAHPLKAVSPYGRSKLVIEDMFRDLYVAEPEWRIILLRYFNPVGAHPSGAGQFLASCTRGIQDTLQHPGGMPPNNKSKPLHATMATCALCSAWTVPRPTS